MQRDLPRGPKKPTHGLNIRILALGYEGLIRVLFGGRGGRRFYNRFPLCWGLFLNSVPLKGTVGVLE